MQPLEEQFLEAVVSLHQSVLGDTLNSQLGKKHLRLLYSVMSKTSDSFVAVALHDSRPIGFVSGALNIESIKRLLTQSASLPHWINIAGRFLMNPRLTLDWAHGSEISKPVYLQNTLVEPILTTIGVDGHFQGLGVGKKLINALEEFFLQHRVPAYRLDTLKSNQNAKNFYIKMGFIPLMERADSIIFVKPLDRKDKII